jgi:hypothetical protein
MAEVFFGQVHGIAFKLDVDDTVDPDHLLLVLLGLSQEPHA